MCTPLTSIENIKKIMEDNDSEEILVVDTMLERHLVGVIYGNDISAKSFEQSVVPSSLNAEQCMKPVSVTARENITLEECQRILDDNHLEHLAIIDDEGHLCGVYDRVNHYKVPKPKPEPTKAVELEMGTIPEAPKVAEDMKKEEKSASANVNSEVAEDDDPEANNMESEGGHDGHTVH